jgi:hypothetical protein
MILCNFMTFCISFIILYILLFIYILMNIIGKFTDDRSEQQKDNSSCKVEEGEKSKEGESNKVENGEENDTLKDASVKKRGYLSMLGILII